MTYDVFGGFASPEIEEFYAMKVVTARLFFSHVFSTMGHREDEFEIKLFNGLSSIWSSATGRKTFMAQGKSYSLSNAKSNF
jgi:hypothetical protein